MKKTLLKGLALAAVGSFLLTGSALAQLFTGAISYSSGADSYIPVEDDGTTPTSLAVADGIDFVLGTFEVSGSPTGDFDTYLNAGDIGNIYDFVFDSLPTLPVTPLWDITGVGGEFISFDLESVSIDFQNASALVLSGTGTIHSTSFDDTAATWSFTANQSGQTFSWSGGNEAVPEPTTMLLLGSGLAGIAGVVRRKKG